MSTSVRVVASKVAVVVLAAVLLSGCATGARTVTVLPTAPSTATAVNPNVPINPNSTANPNKPVNQVPTVNPTTAGNGVADAPCRSFGCSPQQAQRLNDEYSVRLWLSEQPSATDSQALRSTPVLELLKDGQHVGWWVGRLGFGWAASVKCLPTPTQPNCVVLAAMGAHAGSAEVVLLQQAKLVSPATASVLFDSGTPVAADLDHDGLLDVVGVENDYQPDYANGHNFWATYRLTGTQLHRTGCSPLGAAGQPAPTVLLTGPCPVVAQG